jgi:hypothetical protein
MPHGLRRLLAEQVFRMPENHARVVSGHVGEASVCHGVYPELVLVLWGQIAWDGR